MWDTVNIVCNPRYYQQVHPLASMWDTVNIVRKPRTNTIGISDGLVLGGASSVWVCRVECCSLTLLLSCLYCASPVESYFSVFHTHRQRDRIRWGVVFFNITYPHDYPLWNKRILSYLILSSGMPSPTYLLHCIPSYRSCIHQRSWFSVQVSQ